MAEREVLFDAVNVGWPEERRLSQRAAAFGTFALKQVAPASSSEQDLGARGYFETFGHRLPGFNAFGASHITSFEQREMNSRARMGCAFFVRWPLAQPTRFPCNSTIWVRRSRISRCIRAVAAPTKKKHMGRNAKKAGRHHSAFDLLDANRAMSEMKAQKATGIQ
jgi:hypothetical protein